MTLPLLPTTPISAATFSDLTNTHWAYSYIIDLASRGVINGFPDGTYRPEEAVTREQFITLVIQLLEQPTERSETFDDVPLGHWSNAYFAAAVNRGIILPVNYGANIRPSEPITRQDATVWMIRALGVHAGNATPTFYDTEEILIYHRARIATAVEIGLVQGMPGNLFEPRGSATRAQAAVLVTNMSNILNDIRYTRSDGVIFEVDNNIFWVRLADGSGAGVSITNQGLDAWALESLNDFLTQNNLAPASDAVFARFGISVMPQIVWENVAVETEDFFSLVGLPTVEQAEELRYLGTWMFHDPSVWNSVVGGYYFSFYGFRISEASYREALVARDRILSEIIRPGMSEFEQVRAIHNWVVYNVEYDHDYLGNRPNHRYARYSEESQTAWGALTLRRAVCGGYADAIAFLLEPLGIVNYYISGHVWGYSYHAWNMVRINGQWFHIDPTWNRRNMGNHILLVYDWFLLSDSYIRNRQPGPRTWTDSRTWLASSRPTTPTANFPWDRPQPIWDHTLGRWRHRTPEDDMTFQITTAMSHETAGTVTTNPSSARPEQWVTVQANPNHHAGYTFSHWEVVSGNVTLQNPNNNWISFQMPPRDVSLRAVFNQPAGNILTVTSSNETHGSVTSHPQGSIPVGQIVTHSARANAGFSFSHWEVVSGNLTIPNPRSAYITFTMPLGSVNLRAVFTSETMNNLTVTASPSTGGVATASYSGNPIFGGSFPTITSNSNATGQVRTGSLGHLRATPNNGYSFSHWQVLEGDMSFAHNNWDIQNFSMPTGNVRVQAVFVRNADLNVTVTVNNPHAGTATATPITPEAGFSVGSNISLRATPNTGFRFLRWEVLSSNVTINESDIPGLASFTMPSSPVSLRAVFSDQLTGLTITVTSNHPHAINPQITYSGLGTLVTTTHFGAGITVNPRIAGGYQLSHWEVLQGDVNLSTNHSNGTTLFGMPETNVRLHAVLTRRPSHNVSIIINEPGWGTVTKTPSNSWATGEQVRLQATPTQGFMFDRWELLSGNPINLVDWTSNASFSMPEHDVTMRAVFRAVPFIVRLGINNIDMGSVNLLSGNDTVMSGERVSIQAFARNFYPQTQFSHWEVIEGSVSLENRNSATTSFLMPIGNVYIRAHFEFIASGLRVSTSNPRIVLPRTTDLSAGDWVSVIANPHPGEAFSHWEIFGQSIAGSPIFNVPIQPTDPNSPNTQFQMIGTNVLVNAVFVSAP